MASRRTLAHPAPGGPWAWRGVDLVVAAVFGVAMGVVFIAWDYLLNAPGRRSPSRFRPPPPWH